MFTIFGQLKFKSKLEHVIKLDDDINFNILDPYLANYQYKNKYFLSGPNSNTFIRWVLNELGYENVKLPWNAFGKDYKK